MSSYAPLFSIIVPTYNEERLLPRLLESLHRQTLQDYEIIVADDSSTDLTQKIAMSYGARLIINNGIGEYPSRNTAANVSRGSILIFTGADTVMPQNLLSAVSLKFKKDSRLAGIYCPTYPYDAPSWAKVEFTLWYVLTTLLYWITREANASTAFFAIRAQIFRATGGFRNTAFADSSLARQVSKNFKIRPQLDLVIFVSGRRTEMGIAAFNRYHLAMMMGVIFKFFRKSRWLRMENDYRIALHTKSKQSRRQDRPKA
jgi:glycosyltransferase involved in cell wall biosynthesis